MDLVSVIVPIYNSEKYLEDCLKSIRYQTYKNIEIILINDGSEDNSGFICEKSRLEDDRITVIHKENKGVSSARNFGINISKGKYIIFIDSDDFIEIDMIERLIEIQKNKDVDLIIFGMYFNYEGSNKRKKTQLENFTYNSIEDINKILPKLIKNELINSPCNKFYRLDTIKKNSLRFDESINIGEDLLFNHNVFKHINSLQILGEAFYNYNIRENSSLSKGLNLKKYEMLKDVNEIMRKDFIINNKGLELLNVVKYIRIKNIYSCIFDIFHIENRKSYLEKRKHINKIIANEDKNNYNYTNGVYTRILIFIISTKNVSLIYLFSYVIFQIRKLKNIYN